MSIGLIVNIVFKLWKTITYQTPIVAALKTYGVIVLLVIEIKYVSFTID
jgi:hypothetical protein